MSELTSKSTNNLPITSNTLGSATGNPRNKCVLRPGHSLMDWIRFQNSYSDLSGTRGIIISISEEELAKHNTRNNAWMAIHGKVYNVTHYMDFHPGGNIVFGQSKKPDGLSKFVEISSVRRRRREPRFQKK